MRVKALLKRYRIATSQTVQVGELFMDRKTYEVTARGEPLTLPLKNSSYCSNWRVLRLTHSRDQLIEDIWGNDFEGNERTLDVHINRLRERFPEAQFLRIRPFAGWATASRSIMNPGGKSGQAGCGLPASLPRWW